ncbi:MAG: acyl-CoA dehydrogenase family protein [Acidimicrobiia bacterium]
MRTPCGAASPARSSRGESTRRRKARRSRTAHALSLSACRQVLSGMETETRAALHLVVHLVGMHGKEEAGTASAAERAMLRLLMPLAKLYTAKQAIAVVAEGIEAFGGAGFIEDTGLPRHLPDALALAIWEGATSVLALDSLRAIVKEGALEPLLADVRDRLQGVTFHALSRPAAKVRQAALDTHTFVDKVLSGDHEEAEAVGREIAYSQTAITIASLMLEHADRATGTGGGPTAAAAARRWCEKSLTPDPSAALTTVRIRGSSPKRTRPGARERASTTVERRPLRAKGFCRCRVIACWPGGLGAGGS